MSISLAMDSSVLPAKVPTFFQDWKAKGRELTLLVIGDCGSGKTTLVNNLLLGKDIVEDPTPSILPTFYSLFQDVIVTIFETSGLENPDAEGDAEYRRELYFLLHRGMVDVIIYCFKATEARMPESFSRTLKWYHSMGLDWKKTVIALTFATSIPISTVDRQAVSFNVADHFNKYLAKLRYDIKQALIERAGVPDKVVEDIQMAPTTGDVEEHLPNEEQWYEPFWYCVLMCLNVALPPTPTNVALQPSTQPKSVPTDGLSVPPANVRNPKGECNLISMRTWL